MTRSEAGTMVLFARNRLSLPAGKFFVCSCPKAQEKLRTKVKMQKSNLKGKPHFAVSLHPRIFRLVKIISYNVNGIRAALGKGLGQWLQEESPDVLCIQETKARKEQVDTALFDHLGYSHFWHSAEKKGYSGVAILSKTQPDHVEIGCGIDYIDREGRVLRADFGDLSVLSLYFPSGSSGDERQSIKMRFLNDFRLWVNKLRKERPRLVLSGDFNICHQAIDIHDPVRNAKISGFLPEERQWVSDFLSDGYIDSFRKLVKEPDHYSWWSYRANARANNKGWRIDYHMISEALQDNLKAARILPQVKHSDHCPIVVELNR